MRVGNESSDQMDDKIGRAAMARMLNLGNVLELIDNRFNNRSFSESPSNGSFRTDFELVAASQNSSHKQSLMF